MIFDTMVKDIIIEDGVAKGKALQTKVRHTQPMRSCAAVDVKDQNG